MTKRKATKNKGVLPESTQPVAEIKNDVLDLSFLIEEDPIGAKNSKDEYVDPNDEFTIDGLDYDRSESSVNEKNGLGIKRLSSYSESVKEELVEIIAKIRKITSENDPYAFDAKNNLVLSYLASYHTKKCFYVPSFLVRLLKYFGFYAEIIELQIKAPEYHESSGQIKFFNDLLKQQAKTNTPSFLLKIISLRNFIWPDDSWYSGALI